MNSFPFDPESPPPHPGEVLREDVLPHLSMSRAALARHLGISSRLLSDLLAERVPVTLDLARRLGIAIGWGTRYWLGLQTQHDIWRAAEPLPVKIKPLTWRRASARGDTGLARSP